MRTKHWVLVLALGLAACDGLLTEAPRGTLTTEGFYRTAADANAAIAATYQPLSTNRLYGSGYKSGLILTSDIAWAGPFEETASIVALSRMNYDSHTPRVTDQWGAFYTIITRANLLLEKLPEVEMNEAAKAQIAGEAKFLRAFSYFSLVRLHGDVPLVTTAEEQLSVATRTPAAEVFEQILKDAQEAEAALPLQWSSDNRGRATKGAAQTLLADIYLWRSSANATNEWQQAADHAKGVIDSGVYALESDYLDAFLPGSQAGSEEIFAAQASDATGTPNIRTADMFYPRAMGPGGGAGGWGAMVPIDGFYESYAEGDYRRDVTLFTSGLNTTGELVTFPPHVHKYRPSNHPSTRDVSWPIYRYAEVLLFYAEALNELDRPAEAVEYLNMVRARARNGAGGENRAQPADYAGPLTKEAVRDTIFEERRIEMAFEGDRWFDLVRRGWDFFSAQLAKDPTATDVQETDMLWPIPQGEIDLNPDLAQNPGY